MTVVWPEFLATLPEEIYSDGLAESYKHALLDNPLFLNKLLNDSSILSNDEIERSIGVKKQIVDSDPHESGTRKTLNLGHTVGHALESFKLTTNDPWSHGRCVAAGILVALELSRSYFSFDSTIRQRVSDFLMYKYQLSSLSSSVFGSLEPWLIHDKKNENGELRFVLLEDVGKPVFNIPVKMDEVQQAWNKVFGNV
jgi:3-dehydroquinate synthase